MKFTFLGNLIQYGPIKLNDSPVQLCESQNTFRCYFRQASQFSWTYEKLNFLTNLFALLNIYLFTFQEGTLLSKQRTKLLEKTR